MNRAELLLYVWGIIFFVLIGLFIFGMAYRINEFVVVFSLIMPFWIAIGLIGVSRTI